MLKNFWYAVEFSAAVSSQPLPVRLMGQNYVLYRSSQGQVVALADRCIHRGAALSAGWVEGNCIRCPYHGWRYEGNGTCIEIPADQPGIPIPKRARVDSFPVEERYGFIWLFVGDLPAAQRPPIPDLPEFGNPNWRSITGEYTWNAHYTRVVESGLDSSHAPFVHSVFFNLRDEAEVPPYEVHTDEWTASATTISKPPKRAGLLKLIVKRDRPFSSAKLTVHMPNINRIHLDFNFRGYQYIYFASNIPVDEHTTLTKWIGLRNFLKQPWADWNSRKNTNDTYLEDKGVVESQVPQVVPLTGEILLASDSLQLAYRKLLRQYVEQGWGIEDYGLPPLPAATNGQEPAVISVG